MNFGVRIAWSMIVPISQDVAPVVEHAPCAVAFMRALLRQGNDVESCYSFMLTLISGVNAKSSISLRDTSRLAPVALIDAKRCITG